MPFEASDDVIAVLTARMETMEAELRALKERDNAASGDAQPRAPEDRPVTRRALLAKLGGAAVAGAGLAAVGTTLLPGTAGATTVTGDGGSSGDGVEGKTTAAGRSGVYGHNDGTGTGKFWGVFGTTAGSSSLTQATAGVFGTSQSEVGVIGNSDTNFGVLGRTKTLPYAGVVGVGGASSGVITYGGGVVGDSLDGVGVTGVSMNSDGVVGRSGAGIAGVVGHNDGDGYGVMAQSTNGAQLFLSPSAQSVPSATSRSIGEVFLDHNGMLFFCAPGPTGMPTWRRVTTAAPTYDNASGKNAGSINLLPRAIRLYDTRTTATAPFPTTRGKLNPSTSAGYNLQVTGTSVGGVAVPAGAVGVIGTLTVVNTSDPGTGKAGYLTVYPQGSPPSPATSNITWFGANQTLAVLVICALNTSNGQMTIQNGIAGGSVATDVIFDVSGFVF